MGEIEGKIDQLLCFLEEPKFSVGTLRDIQDCFKDSIDVIKDVNDRCNDMQTEINDLDERVTALE